ncbi:hypothetical protein NX801_02830 [Streptomyces sp. LP05-1]|uniref:Secreted protein n=1 Tax=Streptomyces pyxinae TaxID=2970734 RepID=A0ABT2CB70_9ACTN|nr:hypothetical protein [Streptomyces sp. LP05-1]MCS0634613.1 hypothetical protein [Streptomyces sp. LP05-1]
MAPMARRTPRSLLKAGLTLTALGAAFGATGGTAQAAPRNLDVLAAVQGALEGGVAVVPSAVKTVREIRINPLAGTGTDPLSNGVGTQVADFPAFNTTSVTGTLTSPGTLPLVGPLLGG